MNPVSVWCWTEPQSARTNPWIFCGTFNKSVREEESAFIPHEITVWVVWLAAFLGVLRFKHSRTTEAKYLRSSTLKVLRWRMSWDQTSHFFFFFLYYMKQPGYKKKFLLSIRWKNEKNHHYQSYELSNRWVRNSEGPVDQPSAFRWMFVWLVYDRCLSGSLIVLCLCWFYFIFVCSCVLSSSICSPPTSSSLHG